MGGCGCVHYTLYIPSSSYMQWGATAIAAAQVTPSVPPAAPTAAAAGTTTTTTAFTAPPSGGGDQDWNIAGTTTTTHDWAEDTGGDWGATEPKVYIIPNIANQVFIFTFLGHCWKLVNVAETLN